MKTVIREVESKVLAFRREINSISKNLFSKSFFVGMEKSLASLLILILVATLINPAVWMTNADAAAPVTIFEDNFNSSASGTGAASTNEWVNVQSSTFPVRKHSDDGFQGGQTSSASDKGLIFKGSNSTNPDEGIIRKISTRGYGNLELSYSASSDLAPGSSFDIEYAFDGGTFQILESISTAGFLSHSTRTFSIPNPDRHARLDLKVTLNGSKDDLAAIDNVILSASDEPIFYEGFEYGEESLDDFGNPNVLVNAGWNIENSPKVKGYTDNTPTNPQYWSDDNDGLLNNGKAYSLTLDGVKDSDGTNGDSIQRTISTLGHEDISIRYARRVDNLKLDHGVPESYKALYSLDGGINWIQLESVDPIKRMDVVEFGPIPGSGNNPNFMIRFEINGSGGNDDSFLDDIIVWGDLMTDSEDASISGHKFNDLNGNGTQEDGENGLSGVTINLSGTEFAATTTDENGNFTFSNLKLGTYKVCEVIPTGWSQTYPVEGENCTSEESEGHTVVLSESQNYTGVLFGNKMDEVENPNNAPVFSGTTAITGTEDQLITFNVIATDPDGDILVITTDLPDGANYDEGTGAFTWTPDTATTTQAFFYAFDGEATTTHTVVITVNPGEDDPDPEQCPDVTIFSDVTNFVTEKETNAVASWMHPAWTANIPGATWIWATENTENPTQTEIYTFLKSFTVNGTVSSATLTIAADNSYSALINGNLAGADSDEFNFTAEGQDSFDVSSLIQNGENTLAVTLTNMAMEEGTAELNPAGLLYKLTVGIEAGTCEDNGGGNENSLPVFTGTTSATGTEDQNLAFTVTVTDPDNDPLTLTQDLPSGASYDSLTGNFSWTPADATTTQAIFYAFDGTGTSTHTVTITINPEDNGGGNENGLPIFNGPTTASGTENDEVSFVVTVSDPDSDPLTLTQDLPAGASYSTTTGAFTWTPSSATVTNAVFYAFDGTGTSTHTVVITVSADEGNGGGGGNSLPVFSGPTSVSGSEDDQLTFTVTVTDPNNDPLTLGQTLPAGATYSTSTGAFSWTPSDPTSTQAIFTAFDGTGTSTHTVIITITADENSGGGGGGSVILPNNPGGNGTGGPVVLDLPAFAPQNIIPEIPVLANLAGNPVVQNAAGPVTTVPTETEDEPETQVAAPAEALDNNQLANIFQVLKDITWWIWAYIIAELILLGIALRGGLVTKTENNMLAASVVAAVLAAIGIITAAIKGTAEDVLSLGLIIPSIVWLLAVIAGAIGLLMKNGIRLPVISTLWKNIISGIAGIVWLALTAAQLLGSPVYGTMAYLFMTMVAVGYGIYSYFLSVK